MKTHKKIMIAISILIALGAVGTAIAEYITWTAITNVSITSHNDYDPVSVGQEYTLTCTTSTDADCHVGVGAVSDPIVHTWSGPGTFDPQTGTTVTWIPPDSNGNATITVTASDDGSPAYADDTDKTDSVILTVQNTLYYVDVDATGNDNGTTWANAFDDLQDALDAVSSGDEIWVAEGTYKPTTDANRAISFELVDGVGVYGGFDATETARSQRDWNNNVTILSGDIGTVDVNTDNSYRVVTGADNAIIDGFTITRGNAEVRGVGAGGLRNWSSDITVSNCIFKKNYVRGGMSQRGGSATITDCIFVENSTYWIGNWGGGVSVSSDAVVTITNSTFINNSNNGNRGGGGLSIVGNGTDVTVMNCLFVGNSADYDGAAIFLDSGTLTLINSTVTQNRCGPGGNSVIYNEDGTAYVVNCILWINEPNQLYNCDDPNYSCIQDWTGGGTGNIDSDPCFVNIFDFLDGTLAPGTTTTIRVADASIYEVNDEIEYDNDGVARKVTNVNTTTDIITFANDALAANSVAGKTIYNWGIGATDMDEDVHLASDSDCIDAGDPDGTYTGQKDMDGEDRVNGSEVDIGADEYYSS